MSSQNVQVHEIISHKSNESAILAVLHNVNVIISNKLNEWAVLAVLNNDLPASDVGACSQWADGFAACHDAVWTSPADPTTPSQQKPWPVSWPPWPSEQQAPGSEWDVLAADDQHSDPGHCRPSWLPRPEVPYSTHAPSSLAVSASEWRTPTMQCGQTWWIE